MAVLNSADGTDAASLASSHGTATAAASAPATSTANAANVSNASTAADRNFPETRPFPQLHNNAGTDGDADPRTTSAAATKAAKTRSRAIDKAAEEDDEEDDEDIAVAKPFLRTAHILPGGQAVERRGLDDGDDDDDDSGESDESDESSESGESDNDRDSNEAGEGHDGHSRQPRRSSERQSGAGGRRERRSAEYAYKGYKDGGGGGGGSGSAPAAAQERMGHKMHKFTLYETATRYYVVGEDVTGRRFRVLKVDRTAGNDGELSLTDDKIVYSQREMTQLLDTIDDGNRGTGGIKVRCTTWGLLGFIKFTGPFYMMLITKRSTVAVIGGHVIYQITGTELVPLTPGRGAGRVLELSAAASSTNSGGSGSGGGAGGGGGPGGSSGGSMGNADAGHHGHPHHHTHAHQHSTTSQADEARFLAIFNHVNLTQSFYFSYSYDITHTLQHNISKEREALAAGRRWSCDAAPNSMFVWNTHLLQPASESLASAFDWCRPITHGYIDQASISIYGRTAYVAIIARRSRHFAGARFLKRGANDVGYVANDVETEQIVSEASTTSFHAPGPRPNGAGLFANPQYTSYVQHRGSIPLYWTQENNSVTPKPPIELNLVDPFYSAAALHFDDLFARYGAPIYVLDLVKARESTPRESKLLEEFQRATRYLNQFLPADRQIIHHAWDMSRANKSRDVNVIQVLEDIAERVVATTGFFRNGEGDGAEVQSDPGTAATARVQNGVARTNCIDCLDRTNAAQFVIGKCALGHQLYALGILDEPCVRWETDAVNLFTHMYHDHGDTIAVQYGGSQLVNTMETYRKINQWQSQSRDMLESFKRYYNNSFLDGQRQEAYNLFLGNYIYTPGQPLLWDLPTDYHLHHADPRRRQDQLRHHDYINWFTPENLRRRVLPPLPAPSSLPSRLVSKGSDARKNQRNPKNPRNRKNPKSRTSRSSRPSHEKSSLVANPATANRPLSYFDDYWLEFYRPYYLSSFAKMFSFRIKSTMKYIPAGPARHGLYDLSPFKVRNEGGIEGSNSGNGNGNGSPTMPTAQDSPQGSARLHSRRGVSFAETHKNTSLQALNEDQESIPSGVSGVSGGPSVGGLRNWLSPTLSSSTTDVQSTLADNASTAEAIYAAAVSGAGHGQDRGRHAAAAAAAAGQARGTSPLREGGHRHPSQQPASGARPPRPRYGVHEFSSGEQAGYDYDNDYGQDNDNDYHAQQTLNAYAHHLPKSQRQLKHKKSTLEKTQRAQWTLAKMVEDSFNPTVRETEDYERYISHLQNLQVVMYDPAKLETKAASKQAAATQASHGRSASGAYDAVDSGTYEEYVDGSWKMDGLGMRVETGTSTESGARTEARAEMGAGTGLGLGLGPDLEKSRHYMSAMDDEAALYAELLRVSDSPLTVTEGDAQKKRYKAYRKWLQGKSFFKQQPVDGWLKS